MPRLKTRTCRHELVLTPVEKADWQAKAKMTGMNLNEYIRHCVARRRIVPTPSALHYQAVAQLARIGNNLNQQVRALNSAVKAGQNIENYTEAMQTVHEVHQLLRQLQLELLGLTSTVDNPEALIEEQEPEQ